ncbi:TPA: cell filamentation protein Fic, partial [Candidatus Daviesbacteria bacterium]|nr:cell filamentation protein Fic [Candidatus Daviesbacteria bacterium]
MNDTQVNNRQTKLLEFLLVNSPSSRSKIENLLKDDNVSRITIIRDLNYLISVGLIEQVGGGKYVKYRLKPEKELLIPIDLEKYFSTVTDTRKIKYPTFNFNLINRLMGLFSKDELELFETGKDKLKNKFSSLDKTILKRELERFTIELSWKSSQIEGNTYSLLETEELIKNKKEAKGHDKSEAIMILNHKAAFDTILEKKESFKEISVADIRRIHSELVRKLNIKSGIRESAVGITGTKYRPLDNKWQIEEALNKFVVQTKKIKSVPEKALIFLAVIAYLQPFTDGNKRTSRMISNAVLLSNGYYPLSYRSVDEVEYKK